MKTSDALIQADPAPNSSARLPQNSKNSRFQAILDMGLFAMIFFLSVLMLLIVAIGTPVILGVSAILGRFGKQSGRIGSGWRPAKAS